MKLCTFFGSWELLADIYIHITLIESHELEIIERKYFQYFVTQTRDTEKFPPVDKKA